MPITWQVNDGGGVTIVFSNPYSIEESEKTMKEIYASAEPRRPLRFLVDVRQSTPPDIEFVANAITFWQLHVNHMWEARIAVVAATDAQVNMGDMSERAAESRALPFSIRVFREAEWHEAEKWLESGE